MNRKYFFPLSHAKPKFIHAADVDLCHANCSTFGMPFENEKFPDEIEFIRALFFMKKKNRSNFVYTSWFMQIRSFFVGVAAFILSRLNTNISASGRAIDTHMIKYLYLLTTIVFVQLGIPTLHNAISFILSR